MKIHTSITELVGHTPLLRLTKIEEMFSLKAKLVAKIEGFNPAGSVKDRIALNMIETAEKEGLLQEGSVIIEPTSGNTGIGLSAIGAAKGYRVIVVMPDTMSLERRRMVQAYGAEIVLTEGKLGMKGAIQTAQELAEKTEKAFIPSQFVNLANRAAHYEHTGPEIWEDTQGEVDILVAGVGTGGTISGAGRFLKEKKDIRVIAVEPANSPVLSGGNPGPHKIQGIGAGFIPEVYDKEVIDEVVQVKDEDALSHGRLFAKEGFLAGISSGAALKAAIEVASREENEGKTIVFILPDSGDRYFSTALYGE